MDEVMNQLLKGQRASDIAEGVHLPSYAYRFKKKGKIVSRDISMYMAYGFMFETEELDENCWGSEIFKEMMDSGKNEDVFNHPDLVDYAELEVATFLFSELYDKMKYKSASFTGKKNELKWKDENSGLISFGLVDWPSGYLLVSKSIYFPFDYARIEPVIFEELQKICAWDEKRLEKNFEEIGLSSFFEEHKEKRVGWHLVGTYG